MNVFITGAGGYIGGSVAAALIKRGHQVRGLTRSADGAEQLKSYGIDPVIGELDDSRLLKQEASIADMVINTANADHRVAVEALISGLNQSGKRLIHTSGSSIVGDDARGDLCSEVISSEETSLAIDPRKQARREIDLMVMDAAKQNVHSTVIIPGLIYGYGKGVNKHSIQVPFLVKNALEVGSVQIVGKGLNTWSNIHIDDLVDLYLAVSEQAPAGSFILLKTVKQRSAISQKPSQGDFQFPILSTSMQTTPSSAGVQQGHSSPLEATAESDPFGQKKSWTGTPYTYLFKTGF